MLSRVTVAYQTWGALAPTRDNAVLVCHALTGSADVSDWWGALISAEGALDPAQRLHRLQQRPGQLLWQHGPRLAGVGRGVRRQAGRACRHRARRGARAATPAGCARHPATPPRHRRLDGGHAGARVGPAVSRHGGLDCRARGAGCARALGRRPGGGPAPGDLRRRRMAARSRSPWARRGPHDGDDQLQERAGVRGAFRRRTSRPDATRRDGLAAAPRRAARPIGSTRARTWP